MSDLSTHLADTARQTDLVNQTALGRGTPRSGGLELAAVLAVGSRERSSWIRFTCTTPTFFSAPLDARVFGRQPRSRLARGASLLGDPQPFGQVAKWKGAGSTDDAPNFSCVTAPVD